jgi:hypothetical protein
MIMTSAAIADPNLLAKAFAGDSPSTWCAVLRAAEGLPLDEHHRRARRADLTISGIGRRPLPFTP